MGFIGTIVQKQHFNPVKWNKMLFFCFLCKLSLKCDMIKETKFCECTLSKSEKVKGEEPWKT